MTLHETAETGKKFFIGSLFGLIGIFVLVILFRIGITIKNAIFPPQLEPPNMAYGELPPLTFPLDAVPGEYTYTIDTRTGTLPDTGPLPDDLPDRLNVFPMVAPQPGLNSLELAKTKIQKIGFTTKTGAALPETPLGDEVYEWIESTGIKRKIIYDTVSFDFTLTSDYLTSITVLSAQKITDQNAAVAAVQTFLGNISQLPPDINLDLTNIFDEEKHYITTPKLYNIVNGVLEPATSLSLTKAIRVDLYQKNVAYDLYTGELDPAGEPKTRKIDYPILYPNPPFSTMNFIAASGNSGLDIVNADFTHQEVNLTPDTVGTYPLKSATEAYDELRAGKGYIAANPTNNNDVIIKSVYLAYYLGKEKQDYLMPIFVFEGKDGFFAYVSAIKETPIESPSGEPTPTE